jgi:predicted ATPase/DNA-binding winged helix-turn-helix (wHTH) protein
VADPPTASAERAISFGPFRLLPTQRLLLEGDRPLRLGSRALDVLIALVERAGELVSKDELMARVWPNTFVEEANLKVHVSALRRALGDGQGGNRYLINSPGRGYRFVAPISSMESASAATPQSVKRLHNLPAMLTRLIGRADTVSKLAEQLPRQRFLTIVGTGGVGTTSVALALAEALLPAYEDGVWLVELAPLADPRLVPTALPAALGLELRADDPLPGLIAALRDKQMLLVLDNCEHVIESAASLAVAILRDAPRVHILATSREPLRAEGEHVYRLRQLTSPPHSAQLTAAEALAFPAVQLFVERAAASLGEFELSDADAAFVADICSKLDGVPLAIEFAAARVDAFGVRGLASRLDDRLRLLTSGRRTALPRHQTMRATLDWSYEFLPELERLVLQRLAIFAGAFSLEAASAVAASSESAASEIAEHIASLVAKSLVTADVGGATVLYRLLETTRAYALEKLTESGELQRVAQRHAEYYRDLFERAGAEWLTKPAAEWHADYGRGIDEVRTALDWAFSPGGDAAIGVALTVAAAPLLFQMSLINECRGRVEQALAALKLGSSRSERREMQLYAALGWSLMYTTGPARATGAAWTTALALAERLDDTDYQLRALWGLWASRVNNGEFRETLALARRFQSLAASAPDPADALISDRMIGASLHFLGDQAGARRHIERMLKGYITPPQRSDAVRFQFDQRVTARITLARALWLQGFADQAMRDVESNIEHALSINHTLSLCNALAQAACPIALLAGDLPAAERFIAMLLHLAERHALDVWHAYGRCFKGDLLLRRGDVDGGLQLLRAAVDELREARFVQYHTAFLDALARGFAAAGRVAPGLAAIDEALAQSERNEERWCVAELLRIKGDLVLLEGGRKAVPVAEDLFAESLAWARRQAVLSWELRTSISLARLQRRQGRTQEAHGLLASVYGRFTEGFETADLLTAKQFLAEPA